MCSTVGGGLVGCRGWWGVREGKGREGKGREVDKTSSYHHLGDLHSTRLIISVLT